MSVFSLCNIQERASAAPHRAYPDNYVYNDKWSNTRQLDENLTADQYCVRARKTIPHLKEEIEKFLEKHDMSHIVIPFDQYQEYEKSNTPFIEFCQQHGINLDVDVLVIEPNQKTEHSALRKSKFKEPMDVIDYLRTTLIATNRTTNNDQPILDRLIQCMENEDSQDVPAHKNHYHTPHSITKFRAHKSLLNCENTNLFHCQKPDTTEKILAEMMIKTIDQIDLDTLTRKFMSFDRLAAQFATAAANLSKPNQKIDNSNYKAQGRAEQLASCARKAGISLYNRLFEDIGLNRLLGQDVPSAPADSYQEIYDEIMDKIADFYPTITASETIRNTIDSSGVFPDEVIQSRQTKQAKPPKQQTRVSNDNRELELA